VLKLVPPRQWIIFTTGRRSTLIALPAGLALLPAHRKMHWAGE